MLSVRAERVLREHNIVRDDLGVEVSKLRRLLSNGTILNASGVGKKTWRELRYWIGMDTYPPSQWGPPPFKITPLFGRLNVAPPARPACKHEKWERTYPKSQRCPDCGNNMIF